MKRMMSILCVVVLASMAWGAELNFERIKISDEPYESASAFDVDNDGVIDIVSGAFWYAGPDFKTKRKICDIDAVSGYHDNFSDCPMDVNGDGHTDIIAGGWFSKTFQWRENPGDAEKEWITHNIRETGNIERNFLYDLDGDGVDEIMPVTKPLYVYKHNPAKKGFDEYVIPNSPGGHGIGAGDVDGDGHVDIILPSGWFKAPAEMTDLEGWSFQQEFNLGGASVPVLVFDINADGLNDLIVGEAHNYGLYWLEQGKDANGARTWAKHMIDENRSQYHDVQLHDLDNDGALELVSGKRYYAHNGKDPGGKEDLGIYYYEINGGDFQRVTLDFGPPEIASGAGIYFWVEDVDKNGWKDVVAPGKEGLHLFLNQGN